jgi:hypothetical protein
MKTSHTLAWALVSLLVVMALPATPVMGAVTVRATVDRTRIAPGESVQMRITIDGAEGTVNLQDITDFKVFSRGTSTSMQFINGRTSQQVTHNYLLIPQKTGRLTIPAITVNVKGRDYATEPILVEVVPPSTDPKEAAAREVWVEASVSVSDPYVGQQIIYTFSLVNAVQVSEAKFQPPEFEGFDTRELEKRESRRKIIKGREHVVTRVHYILIPRKAQALTITPAGLHVGVVRPDQRRRRSRGFDSIFDDPFFNRGIVEQRYLETEAITVTVRPLPPYNGKAPFTGLVGQFDLQAAIEKRELEVGDSTTLTVTLSGQGNIIDAAPPALDIPKAFKTYTDTPEESIQVSPNGFEGWKIFRTALVPIAPGDFNMVPASLTYFDIQTQNYITLDTAPIDVSVAPSAVAQSAPVTITPAPLANRKQAVAFTGRDILPVKEELDAIVPQRRLSVQDFAIWLAAPLLPFLGVLVFQRSRKKNLSPADRMRIKARQELKKASINVSNPDACLGHLFQALSAAIFAAANRSGEALTWKEAEALLLACGRDAESASDAADLLARIESSKFSGAVLSEARLTELVGQTRKIVRKLAP